MAFFNWKTLMDNKTQECLSLLDLAPGATLEDVKRAYRELALIWHPDKVPDRVKDRATRKFQHLTEAYQHIARNPSVLDQSWSAGQRSSRQTDHGSTERTGSTSGATDSSDMLSALRGYFTDRDEGVYVYPDIDRGKAIEFAQRVSSHKPFSDYRLRHNDILVFCDIDGSGEDGMAITRRNHLVNNNVDALFNISELADVKLEDAMFFWSQLSVRKKSQATYQLAGYTSNQAGQVFTAILRNLIAR